MSRDHVYDVREIGIDSNGKAVLEMDVSPDLLRKLQEAANHAGVDIDTFVSQAVTNELQRLIDDHTPSQPA